MDPLTVLKEELITINDLYCGYLEKRAIVDKEKCLIHKHSILEDESHDRRTTSKNL